MHNIEKNEATGTHSYFGVGEPAWHKLGTTIEKAVTAEEALKLANLDYTVQKRQAMFPVEEDYLESGSENGIYTIKVKPVKNKFHSFRTDTGAVLGTVGKSWTPLQNRDAFRFFDALVDRDEAIYETGGVLGEGERAWILAKLPSHIRVGNGDDLIDEYILVSNGFNGKTAVEILLTPVRVVCNNTLLAALGSAKNKVSIPHTPNIEVAIEKASEALGLFSQYNKDMEDVFNLMANKQVKQQQVDEFLNTLLPKNPENTALTQGDKYRMNIAKFFEAGVGQDMKTTHGTVFGLYNAVTGFTSHVKEYGNNEAKFKNLLVGGSSARMNQQAFDLALEMVG